MAKSWTKVPEADQPATWIGEAQDLDGTWTPITEPGTVRATIRAARAWREAEARDGHLIETRVTNPK